MSIGTPYFIGDAGTATSVATEVIAVGTTTTAGDAIVVGASMNSASSRPSSCADSQGNVYVMADQQAVATGYEGAVLVATHGSGGSSSPTAALVSGTDTITMTYSAVGAAAKNAYAVGVSGVTVGSVADKVVLANGTSTTASATLAALTASTDIVFFFLNVANATGTPAYTGPLAVVPSGPIFQVATNQRSQMAYALPGSASSAAYTATMTSSGNWDCVIVSLLAAATNVSAGLAAASGVPPASVAQAALHMTIQGV